jgi:hypothetical protein
MKILEFSTVISNKQANQILCSIVEQEGSSSKLFEDGNSRNQWRNFCVKDFRGQGFIGETVYTRVQLEKRYHSEKKEEYLRCNIYLNSNQKADEKELSFCIDLIKTVVASKPCDDFWNAFLKEDGNE